MRACLCVFSHHPPITLRHAGQCAGCGSPPSFTLGVPAVEDSAFQCTEVEQDTVIVKFACKIPLLLRLSHTNMPPVHA